MKKVGSGETRSEPEPGGERARNHQGRGQGQPATQEPRARQGRSHGETLMVSETTTSYHVPEHPVPPLRPLRTCRAHLSDAIFQEDSGILDGGASAGLAGAVTLDRRISTLRKFGIDFDVPAHTHDCSKRFRLGDDNKVSVARTASAVPTSVQNQSGIMMFYVIPGSTPLLVARPIMEKRITNIHHGKNTITCRDGTTPARRGHKGHYMLRLGAFVSNASGKSDFAIMPHDVAKEHNLRYTDDDDLYFHLGSTDGQ